VLNADKASADDARFDYKGSSSSRRLKERVQNSVITVDLGRLMRITFTDESIKSLDTDRDPMEIYGKGAKLPSITTFNWDGMLGRKIHRGTLRLSELQVCLHSTSL